MFREFYLKPKSKVFLVPVLLFLITAAIYLISNRGEATNYNYFVRLADAFLHGRLYILHPPSWINELVLWHGKYYTVFPPMPAFLLLPFVAFFGSAFSQTALSVLIGAINVSLCYLVLSKVFKNIKVILLISFLYAFGTMQWYHASIGSAWYMGHVISNFFIWLSLLEGFTKKRFFLIGVLIGFSYLSTLPSILACVFILVYFLDDFIDIKNSYKINFKNIFFLCLGILPALLFNIFYNYVRFGAFFDLGYALLPVLNEPWYKYGLVNVKYIPIHLTEIFTALPTFIAKPPYVLPSLNVMALWFVTPAFLLIPLARFKTRLVLASLITVVIMSLPSLLHGGNGFTQFGFRHALDFLPFLLILTASGMREKANLTAILLIVLSVLINLWGIIMINFFNAWVL